MREILVGIDGSEGSRRALRWAAAEARQWQAHLSVVTAWSYPAAAVSPTYGAVAPAEEMHARQEELGRKVLAEEGLEDPQDLRVSLRVVEGPAAPSLIRAAEDADLLVVGARGVGGFMGLVLGSVSQHCVGHAPCPVVVVPQDER
jgi:nucleotide-binding universal stress UspA family protein